MAEEGIQLTEHGYTLGSGLAEVFEVLSRATEERLLSLTYKMGSTRAEVMVHAMCLILLKKNKDAHAKLLTNNDSRAGNFLAEMIEMHGERLNGSHFVGFKISDLDVEMLLDIARVFAVLVREQLCDPMLRDQAYRTAHEVSKKAGWRFEDVERVLEEIREVCGLQVIDDNTGPAFTTGGLSSLDVSKRNVSHPSSLRSSSVCSSHSLEISSPTITESSVEEPKPLISSMPQTSVTTISRSQALRHPDTTTDVCATSSLQTPHTEVLNGSTAPKPKPCLDDSGSSHLLTSKNTNPETGLDFSFNPTNTNKPGFQPSNLGQNTNMPPFQTNFSPQQVSCSEVEDFYSFMILHEPEDADEALRLKNKLESIISGKGATFSEFVEPGRSTLCCMEDAINNSAFTLLLLTRNFNTNLSETSTDSAIFNSLEKCHKKNSVIPLLPQENCLPKDQRRLLLRCTVPLDESSKAFERAAFRAMSPEKVANQKKVWKKELRIKRAIEEQKRLQEDKIQNMDLQRETERLARLRFESDMFYAQSGALRAPPCHTAPGQGHGATPAHTAAQQDAWQQPPSCIHIENAHNVMIGNHSRMNIELAQQNSGDED